MVFKLVVGFVLARGNNRVSAASFPKRLVKRLRNSLRKRWGDREIVMTLTRAVHGNHKNQMKFPREPTARIS